MKKQDIVRIVRAGCLDISNHSLNTAHAYKVVKFRKSLRAAVRSIDEDTENCRQDAGIKDASAFDKELFELRKNKERGAEQQERLNEMEDALRRFHGLREQMLEEEIEFDGVKALPYEEWRLLQDENKEKEINGRKVDILSGEIEDLLEGVLWTAPEE